MSSDESADFDAWSLEMCEHFEQLAETYRRPDPTQPDRL